MTMLTRVFEDDDGDGSEMVDDVDDVPTGPLAALSTRGTRDSVRELLTPQRSIGRPKPDDEWSPPCPMMRAISSLTEEPTALTRRSAESDEAEQKRKKSPWPRLPRFFSSKTKTNKKAAAVSRAGRR
mmetsp:Transcript_1316/g.3928  ORF Transcript_1316/g.3928 Transcript_1316/m.3928 type:complete len:127 (+) Transcript_1316:183-563(+)